MEGEQHIGRIIILDTAKEKPQQGKVIAARGDALRHLLKQAGHGL